MATAMARHEDTTIRWDEVKTKISLGLFERMEYAKTLYAVDTDTQASKHLLEDLDALKEAFLNGYLHNLTEFKVADWSIYVADDDGDQLSNISRIILEFEDMHLLDDLGFSWPEPDSEIVRPR